MFQVEDAVDDLQTELREAKRKLAARGGGPHAAATQERKVLLESQSELCQELQQTELEVQRLRAALAQSEAQLGQTKVIPTPDASTHLCAT